MTRHALNLVTAWLLAFHSPVATVYAQTSHNGCIHMDILHSTTPSSPSRRAAGDVETQLTNRTDVAYYALLQIGTPPQPVYVQLDTGSFELWVNPTCSGTPTGLDSADTAFCQSTGVFDPSKSSTLAQVPSSSAGGVKGSAGATLRYGIGAANVTYVKDTILLSSSTGGGPGVTLKGVQFGTASSSVQEFSGILGIGYGQGHNTVSYPNFIDQLALQGQTSGRIFSVALGSKSEGSGAIVFGGIDTSKYAGQLASLPIIPATSSPDGVARYWVQMNSVSLSAPGRASKAYGSIGSMPVFLDTGSTLSLLPQALADAIAMDFGASGANANSLYEVDCSLANLPGSLDFQFNGVKISVAYKELIRTSTATTGMGSVNAQAAKCVLGISPSSTFALLGDTFMRSAYTVFDLDNNLIYLQQYQNCGATPSAVTNAANIGSTTGVCGQQKPASSSVAVAPAAPTTLATSAVSAPVASSSATMVAPPPAVTQSSSSNANSAATRTVSLSAVMSTTSTTAASASATPAGMGLGSGAGVMRSNNVAMFLSWLACCLWFTYGLLV